MALSGTKTFNLDTSDILEEAFERCGLELRTGYDARSGRRSMNLLLASWANEGVLLWTVERTVLPMVQGTEIYTLTDDVIDILDLYIRRDGTDIQLTRISRGEYSLLPNKDTLGRPVEWWLNRQTSPELTVWPTPENSTDSIIYYALRRMDDISDATNNVDLPTRFLPAFVSGVAYYLAIKKAPDKLEYLKPIYEEDFKKALDEDREKTSLYLTPRRQVI